MPELYQNKYRIPSTRLPNWDYGSSGVYFITICTKNRVHWFGKIKDRKMNLSQTGKIVNQEWIKTGNIRPRIVLDEYVIMPNHFHAIVILYDAPKSKLTRDLNTSDQPKNKFGPQCDNLASIIRGFKSNSCRLIRKYADTKFCWQPRYYDHIIYKHDELQRIRTYIRNNPAKWFEDSLNS